MKIRNGYVSNSSSSSFLVKRDCSEFGISCLKLTKQQLELLKEDFKQILGLEQVYLTQYLYDYCQQLKNDIIICQYDCGGHFGPYNQEYYNEYGYRLFLKKEHDVAKQMNIKQFIKEYKKQGLPHKVIVQYKNDGVFLKYVYD